MNFEKAETYREKVRTQLIKSSVDIPVDDKEVVIDTLSKAKAAVIKSVAEVDKFLVSAEPKSIEDVAKQVQTIKEILSKLLK